MRIAVAAVLLAWLAALSIYDITQRRLPNTLTVPGAGVIVVGALAAGRGPTALAGAAALTTVYLVVHLVAPTGLGAGDVKLALGLGALTGSFGADVWFLAALGAPLLTGAIGVLARLGWSATTVPHGPSMCAASVAAVGLSVLS
jgi:leader peptidase (prepilin peptidase)/N-methyltransferase